MARCPTCHRRLLTGRACVEHGGPIPESTVADDIGEAPSFPRALDGCVGSGGFAAVWSIVGGGVLKVAHANHELARARMAREAEALGAVGSPAVPQLLGHGVLDDGRAWIEMERIAGTDLGNILATSPLRSDHAIGLGVRILDALSRIHQAGFAHRDLKPDNIVRRKDGSLVILDLGLARKLPDDPDDPNRAGVQVGSVEYMAPEQLLDATTARAAADIYAFGCILYELCSGRPPFIGDAAALERAHAALRPPPLGALARVPSALEQLCHECLAKQPVRRPASAAAVAARLREVGDASAGQRTQHSMSVISSGKQPVVLLWAELPKVDRALVNAMTARKVLMISQRGRKVLGGIAGVEHADPAGAALAAARDLLAAGARVALHLDAVAVTHEATGLRMTGPSVDKPETWLPATPWTGAVLTRAFATVAQVPTRPSEAGPLFFALGDATKPSDELFGREALLSDLATEAAAALSGVGPGLGLLIGDAGIGKSAVAHALAPRLAELGARVISGVVPPPGSGKPGYSALAELVGTPTGPIVRAIGDALRDAARAKPLAIVIDDLHLADHELLDALEYATLGGEPLPLWVLGVASPRLDLRRPGFGSRAERPKRVVVPPLDADSAIQMTAALLRPAEYPPIRALRQIATIARGNPMHLATLVREIHDRGAIRARPGGEHFLDTTALDALPPIALGPWLAARELAALGPELVALARVCAILGEDFDRYEITCVILIAERAGSATTTIDLDVGLAELETSQILISNAGRWAFRQSLLEEGIYTTTNEAERRALHAAALEYWLAQSADELASDRVARHAEAVGEQRTAAAAFAKLGALAQDHHRTLDADQAWHGAVRNLDARDLERCRALLGRARARYRLQRVREALVDLEEALGIAVANTDRILEIETLVEKATALDWSDAYAESAATAERARERLTAGDPAGLAAEVDLAIARGVYREGRFVEAVPLLERVIEATRGSHTHTEIVATVLLAPALVEARRLADAERVFAELIERCRDLGDLTHLGAAYANRTWLWADRGDLDRVASDLGVVIQIARESGQASLERIATYNLAENRLWEGRLDESVNLARRSLSLQRGHGEGATHFDQLLLARIHAARDERGEVAELLGVLRAAELSDADRLVLDVLACVDPATPTETWATALTAAAGLGANQRIELAVLAARDGKLTGEIAREIRDLATGNPIWAQRAMF